MSREKNAVEDPSKRFERHDVIVSARSSVTGFRGYDRETGIEITWHEVNIQNLSADQKKSAIEDVQRLKSLRNEALMSLIHYWLSEDQHKLFIITESTYTNSIRNQIGHLDVRLSAISNWFRPVLGALAFLHGENPPIIHCRVSLNSIFVKASSGHVKLISPLTDPASLLDQPNEIKIHYSTPPELLNCIRTPASDIWMYGISLLEAITREQPYSECDTTIKLIEKIDHFIPPDSLKRVKNDLARNLIASCLVQMDKRPTAKELYDHPFFSQNFEQDIIPEPEKTEEYEVLFSAKIRSSSTRDIPKLEENKFTTNAPPRFVIESANHEEPTS